MMCVCQEAEVKRRRSQTSRAAVYVYVHICMCVCACVRACPHMNESWHTGGKPAGGARSAVSGHDLGSALKRAF